MNKEEQQIYISGYNKAIDVVNVYLDKVKIERHKISADFIKAGRVDLEELEKLNALNDEAATISKVSLTLRDNKPTSKDNE